MPTRGRGQLRRLWWTTHHWCQSVPRSRNTSQNTMNQANLRILQLNMMKSRAGMEALVNDQQTADLDILLIQEPPLSASSSRPQHPTISHTQGLGRDTKYDTKPLPLRPPHSPHPQKPAPTAHAVPRRVAPSPVRLGLGVYSDLPKPSPNRPAFEQSYFSNEEEEDDNEREEDEKDRRRVKSWFPLKPFWSRASRLLSLRQDAETRYVLNGAIVTDQPLRTTGTGRLTPPRITVTIASWLPSGVSQRGTGVRPRLTSLTGPNTTISLELDSSPHAAHHG